MKEISKSKNNTSRIVYRHFDNHRKQNVLLLHGFLGSQYIWDPLIPELSKHFNLIVPDLPGHGETDCHESILTMDFIAASIIDILNDMNIPHFHIVGHSMGGYAGLSLLNQYPDRVKSLTLLNSTALDDSPSKKEDRLRAIRVFDLSPKVYIKEAISNLFHEPNIKRCDTEVTRLQNIALSTSVQGAQASLRGMRERQNFVSLINSTKVPVQYISGKYDSTVPFDSIVEQIKNPNIRLTKMKNSGHMSFAEEPEYCLKAIINFIIHTS